jgi:hypothetical protein
MEPEISPKLRKIRKVSVILRIMCKVLLVLIAVVGVGAVVSVLFGVGGISYEDTLFRTAGLPLGSRLMVGAVTSLAFAALLKCVYHLSRLFGDYAKGEIFTRSAVGELRKFGVACLLWGVMKFIWGISLSLTAEPQRTFHGQADSFVIGAILIVIAWFMDMAVDLREENELAI